MDLGLKGAHAAPSDAPPRPATASGASRASPPRAIRPDWDGHFASLGSLSGGPTLPPGSVPMSDSEIATTVLEAVKNMPAVDGSGRASLSGVGRSPGATTRERRRPNTLARDRGAVVAAGPGATPLAETFGPALAATLLRPAGAASPAALEAVASYAR
jgi:hypothetical protein